MKIRIPTNFHEAQRLKGKRAGGTLTERKAVFRVEHPITRVRHGFQPGLSRKH